MAMLELVAPRPDWMSALEIALTRPPGVPERRGGEDPWAPPDDLERPRRISDDLAWLRHAVDEPEVSGLRVVSDTSAVGLWEAGEDPDAEARLDRLAARGVLDAGGFLLHA